MGRNDWWVGDQDTTEWVGGWDRQGDVPHAIHVGRPGAELLNEAVHIGLGDVVVGGVGGGETEAALGQVEQEL